MASTIAGHTLHERPHAANELLTNDRIAYLVGAPVATSRHRRRHVGIGARRFRVAPSVRCQSAEVLRFLARIESSDYGVGFGDSAHPRATTGACAMTLLQGQTQLRLRSLEHRAGAGALGGSLSPSGEPSW